MEAVSEFLEVLFHKITSTSLGLEFLKWYLLYCVLVLVPGAVVIVVARKVRRFLKRLLLYIQLTVNCNLSMLSRYLVVPQHQQRNVKPKKCSVTLDVDAEESDDSTIENILLGHIEEQITRQVTALFERDGVAVYAESSGPSCDFRIFVTLRIRKIIWEASSAYVVGCGVVVHDPESIVAESRGEVLVSSEECFGADIQPKSQLLPSCADKVIATFRQRSCVD